MDALLRDLRYAVRGLLRTPGFTAAAVLALALGIGATTAIFTVVHAVLLRSMGWGDESRLVEANTVYEALGIKEGSLSPPEVFDLKGAPCFEAFGGIAGDSAALQGAGAAERVVIAHVTAGFFDALAARAAYGRTFASDEDFKGKDGVAVISHAAFRKRYGADPAVVGRSVTLDGRPYQIIGVLPEGFSYGEPREFYLPFGFTPKQLAEWRGAHWIEGVGRLRAGLTLAAARTQIAALSARLRADYPDNYPSARQWSLALQPLRDRFTGSTRQPLLVLFGAVLLVLLIACANVANLLLARSASRARELAVRAAVGASRARIVRQLLTEGLLMAAAGTALGIAIAIWGLDALLASAPHAIRDMHDVGVSRAVLGFSMLLTVATTLLFALVPALRASRVDLATALKDGAAGTSGVPAARLRSVLVGGQVAISLCLLAGAGLMLRSFAGVLEVSPGFDPDGAVIARLAPGGPQYDEDDAARQRYFDDGLRAAAAIPGAQLAGGIDRLPATRSSYSLSYFIEGYQPQAGEPQPSDQIRRLMPGYFAAMRQRVVKGREFTAADDAKAPLVAMVNEAWVRRFFPGKDVIGQRIRLDSKTHGDWRTIVGVESDAREKGLDTPAPPVYYFAAAQMPPDQMMLVVRGPVAVAALAQTLARVEASQPVDEVKPLGDILASSLATRRFPLQLLGAFAALALLLSALGIYGVTSYAVAQRTKEIGLRMAIGASPGGVMRMVLAATLRVVLAGLAVGAAGALAGARVLAAQLYAVSPRDPPTYLLAAGLLGAVALLASGLPALRAARVDPISALRAE
ncbi:MAG TPA: ABC transporter permease [Myxococcales bacterium]|nr:ABC transporter permease [Myxococcales bacterium]